MLPESVKLFENPEFGSVRVLIRDGEPWFVAKGVAQALGYTDTDQAIRNHCNYAELFKPVEVTGLEIGPRGMYFIPEADVYALVFGSRLPQAKKFRAWVYEDILPSVRKTGSYSVHTCPPIPAGLPDFTNPGIAARAWAEQYDRAEAAEAKVKALEGQMPSATDRKFLEESGYGKEYRRASSIDCFDDLLQKTPGAIRAVTHQLMRICGEAEIEPKWVSGPTYIFSQEVIDMLRQDLESDASLLGDYRRD